MKQALFVFGFITIATTAGAQVSVGYPPQKSPYRDLEYHSELTAFGGYFSPASEPAGVAPRGGPMGGIRYEVNVGGPVQLVARFARASSERNVIDPTLPAASRALGSVSWPVYLADVGFSLNLTGQRSWHGIVPVTYWAQAWLATPGRRSRRIRTDSAPHLPFPMPLVCDSCRAGAFRFVPTRGRTCTRSSTPPVTTSRLLTTLSTHAERWPTAGAPLAVRGAGRGHRNPTPGGETPRSPPRAARAKGRAESPASGRLTGD